MNLFDPNPSLNNLLPFDGEVYYYGVVLNAEERKFYYDKLLNGVEWKNDEAVLFGKTIITRRKAAWYGDKSYSYTYSNSTKHALPWTVELKALKNLVEKFSSANYNSVLLNLYHDGTEGMAWHSDAEKALAKNGSIASITLGAERKFSFKHKKNKQTVSLILQHGSLLVMKGATQQNWLHRLPPTIKVSKPRINLTFRTILESEQIA